MIKGRKVYDPLTDTWSTGYWVADDKGNYYPVWQKGAEMNIDVFIKRAKEKAEEYKYRASFFESDNPVNAACIKVAKDHEQLAKWFEKFKEYQQLEEQGRLIKLPCKVGDTVWDNDFGRPCAYTITAFSFGECEEYICEPVTTKKAVFYYANSSGSITGSFAESEIGKSVFLNKSEAEAKLKELRGGENE